MNSMTKQETVYNVLKENILDGHLKPGTRLVLSRIAKELGVSEIPVREAIRMLEAKGLVTLTPHAGAQVSELDAEDVQEIAMIRSLLEGYASKSAVPFIKQKDLNLLYEYMDKMEECINNNDGTTFGVLNRQFHSLIYELCPYKRLQKMIYELWDGYERTRSVFSIGKNQLLKSLNEHKEILYAIESGNSERVEYLVRKHRMKSAKSLIEYLKEENNKTKE